MKQPCTKKDDILKFLTSYIRKNGYAPSIREIGEAVGLTSTASVHYHLEILRQEGAITTDGVKKRTIRVVGLEREGKIPVVGVVTAGQPILAVENIEGYLPWDGEDGMFALRVRGDSMINAGILDGDKVVVRPQNMADSGEIVVALIEDSATVKRLKRENGEVWLMPENPSYAPIDGTNAQILGKVKAVVREY